jgi:hypothetical protein
MATPSTPSAFTRMIPFLALCGLLLLATPAGMLIHEPGLEARVAQASYNVEINVTVVDNALRKIPNATVYVSVNGSTIDNLTNAQGFTIFSGLSDEFTSYVLWANKSRYQGSPPTSCSVTPNRTTNLTLTIAGGSISGTVTSKTGPIDNATVTISGIPHLIAVSTSASPTDGNYTLSGIPSGDLRIDASAPGYSSETVLVTLGLLESRFVSFVLAPINGTISGYVFRAATMEPLLNASVSVVLPGITVIVNSTQDGSYLIHDVPEGTYSLTASKEGFYPANYANVIVVKATVTQNINFSLVERPTALYGVVRSGTLLLPGANISVAGTNFYNRSDSQGAFRIENITAGTYDVTATLSGYVTALFEGVVIPVGGEVRLDINLTALPGAVLRGTVVARDTGKPLENVYVTVVNIDGGPITKTTNVDGGFEFTGLVGGNYTIQFQIDGYKPLEISGIEVSPEGITERSFRLEPLGKSFGGFIFGFDMAHSMMILALFLTIVILAVAVYLRIRTFQAPESAPAVYDQAEEEAEEEEKVEEPPAGPRRKKIIRRKEK